MKQIGSNKDVSKLKEQKYIQSYHKIKKRCQFQKDFAWSLLIIFFTLQYSVPIFLVVLGSIAGSREQLIMFFSSHTEITLESDRKSSEAEAIVSRIIYLTGLITILLGIINNIVRPAESYDTAARYHNKFSAFEQNFELEFLAVSSSPEILSEDIDSLARVIKFLIFKNNELCALIEEYNDARSLYSLKTRLQASNKSKNRDDVMASNKTSFMNPSNSSSFLPNPSIRNLIQEEVNSKSLQSDNLHENQ